MTSLSPHTPLPEGKGGIKSKIGIVRALCARTIPILLVLYWVVLLLFIKNIKIVGATGTSDAHVAPSPMLTPTPGMSFLPERLQPPPTVYPPTQADQGAQVYYQVCMVCHGDRGQGLTEDYLNLLDPGDRNCWQSHCHASNHPLEGFEIPRFAPAVINPGVLEPFRTALVLHDYLKARMPWQAPGSLSGDEYWQLTAFLVRANGYDPGSLPLDEQRAAAFSLGPKPTPTSTPASPLAGFMESAGIGFWVAAGGALVLVMLVVLIAAIRRPAKRSE